MPTIEDIRHTNLLLLISELSPSKEDDRGGIQRLATLLERSHSQISQLKTRAKHSTSGKPRNIGSPLARQIEAKCNKPEGWMDQAHHKDDDLMTAKLRELVDEAVLARLEAGAKASAVSPDAAVVPLPPQRQRHLRQVSSPLSKLHVTAAKAKEKK